jgi:hypothetical protein
MRSRAVFVPYQCFGLLDVLIAEQELAIEVAEIDGVEVYDVNLAEAGENEVLEEFAADAASSYHQDARLERISDCHMPCVRVYSYLFDALMEGATEALPSKLVACHCGIGGGDRQEVSRVVGEAKTCESWRVARLRSRRRVRDVSAAG